MKKNLAVKPIVLLILVALFAGCGATESPAETASKEAAKNLTDLMVTQQQLGENYDPNDPEAVAKVMEGYAQYGAKIEQQEFEKAESVDAPSGFPSSLIYSKGKVTSSSDNGDESYVNKSITIKTTEELKTVKDFYKNLFSQSPWKITSQSSASDSASYSAEDASDLEASVDISSNPYSKIVEISVDYLGNITE